MEPSEKILAWGNKFHEFETQTVEGVECVSTPFPLINESSNKLNLDLTAEQLRELLSSIQIGAEWAYPDKSQQILFNFWRGLICAPEVQADSDCVEYPSISPFITYRPNNPLSDIVPSGYLFRPWVQFGSFDSIFPDWVDNWIQGQIEYFSGYQASDVLCNIASLPVNSVQAFLDNGGILPTIEIRFSGVGTVEIELLSFPLGGKAIVELDQAPNIIDYLTSGIIDPASFVVELNRDVLSFPPDEYPINNVEIKVENTGDHVLYIVFVPNVDDALIPVGFGGGLRSVELCGFTEVGTNMGIQSVFWDGCELKQIANGVTTTIVTAAQIEACLNIPEPSGGGGVAAIGGNTYNKQISTTNFTNQSFANITGTNQSHGFTRTHALIGIGGTFLNSGNNDTIFRPSVQRGATKINGNGLTQARAFSTSGRESWVWDYFPSIGSGVGDIYFDARVSAGTGTIAQGQDLQYVVIEFDDPNALFVEDIRIEGGELQKKIAGIWIDVTDSFSAIIAGLQSQVNSALSQAASAIATNVTQANQIAAITAVNNNQNTRLNALEAFQEDAELSLSQLSLTVNDHENRIDALEAASGGGGLWNAYVKDFRLSQGNWSASGGTWISGSGFRASSNGSPITLTQSIEWVSQRNSYMIVDFRVLSGSNNEMLVNFLGLSTDSMPIVKASNASVTLARVYLRVPTITAPLQQVAIRFEPLSNDGLIQIEKIQFIGLPSLSMFTDGD